MAFAAPTPGEPPKKRRKLQASTVVVEQEILSSIRSLGQESPADGEAHFANHIASVLRELPSRQRALAKIEIDRILFSFQFPEPIPPMSIPPMSPPFPSQY